MPTKRELFCYNSLERFMVSNLQITDCALAPLKRGEDPPDAYLTIDHSTFAVEVTSTEVMRDVSIGKGGLREETYEHSVKQFIKEVEAAAQHAGILKGTYAIYFNRPMALSYYRQIRDYAQARLIQYIEQTQGLATMAIETIYYDDQPICHISKLHNQRNIIRVGLNDAAWAKSPEVVGKVCGLLQAAVTDKKERFLTRGKMDPSILSLPRILLILNTYAFADASMYSNCTSLIQSLDFFHSIFVVWGDASCSLIFTTDEAWSRAPRHSGT